MFEKNRIKELREKMKMSQDELATKLGVTRQAISLYEKGQRKPSEKAWITMANVFENQILEEHHLNTSDQVVRYIKGYGLITPEIKQEIIKMLHDSYFGKNVLDYVFEISDIDELDFKGKASVHYAMIDSIKSDFKSLKKAIDKFLNESKIRPMPYDFYSPNEKRFIINKKINDYWISNFGFLFKNDRLIEKFKDSSRNSIDNPDFSLIKYIRSSINKENLNKNKTKLGEVFIRKFKNDDNQLHFNMSESLIFAANSKEASGIIDKYIDTLIDLKQNLKEHDD